MQRIWFLAVQRDRHEFAQERIALCDAEKELGTCKFEYGR